MKIMEETKKTTWTLKEYLKNITTFEIKEPLVYDGFNQTVRDNNYVGTITTNSGKDLKRNGQGIIEKNEIKVFQYGHGYVRSGEIRNDVFPTVRTANADKANNAILQSNDVRVRKLTPKECWRLMGFDDESFFRATYGGDVPIDLMKRLEKRILTKFEWKELWRHIRKQKVSNAQLYKQAGNSIVVDVLMAIFKELF